MGMSGVVAYVMMFIVVVGMIFVLVSSHTVVIKEKSGAIGSLSDIKQKKYNTDITVEDIIYSQTNMTFILLNDGVEKLHLDRIDTYIGEKVNHESSLLEEYNIINSQLWDPGEKLELIVEMNMSQNENKSLIITTENAGKLEFTFITHVKKINLIGVFKTSLPIQDDKTLIDDSDDTRSTVTLDHDTNVYLYANYSFSGHAYNSEIEVEHYFDNSANVIAKDLDYFNGTHWINIGELSPYESESSDLFEMNLTPDRLRINYYSNDAGLVYSYIDMISINANVTQWWVN